LGDVGALRDRDVREEARAVLPLLNHLRRALRGHDAASASAAEDLLDVLDADELRGHELADVRALPVAERREVRAPAGRTAPKRLRHFVFNTQSWSLRLGLGRSLARRLDLLVRRGLARLHASARFDARRAPSFEQL